MNIMDKPIEMDTIQGMDVSSDSDWLQNLLKSVIKGTGFPSNYIDATQEVDFSRTVVMQNALFVRNLISDQIDFEEDFTRFIRLLYINEYSNGKNNDEIQRIAENITVSYPRPAMLNFNNINDQISTAGQTIDFITNVYIDENNTDDPTLKLDFRRELAKDIISSLNWNKYDNIYEKVSQINKENKLNKKAFGASDETGGDEGGDDLGGYEGL